MTTSRALTCVLKAARSREKILQALRDHNPAEAHGWINKHILTFLRGYELANLDIDAPVGLPRKWLLTVMWGALTTRGPACRRAISMRRPKLYVPGERPVI